MESIVRKTDIGINSNLADSKSMFNTLHIQQTAQLPIIRPANQVQKPICNKSILNHLPQARAQDDQCCAAPRLGIVDGFSVCMNCGIVHAPALDQTPRRAFNQDEINQRKSNEPVYRPIGPRTIIKGNLDAKGNNISPELRSQYNRLSKINRSLISSYERNLWIALPKLQRLQQCLNLSDLLSNESFRIYSHAVKQRLTMGRSIETLLTAAIFAAMRIHGMTRTLDEVCALADLPQQPVLKTYRRLVLYVFPVLDLKMVRTGPSEYVDRICSTLNIQPQVRNIAKSYLKDARRNRVVFDGKDPKGFSAAAIYLACKHLHAGLTQNQIAKQAHVTEMTLRSRLKEIAEFIE